MPQDPASRRSFLPLGVDLAGTVCVVVGGGAVGTRKASSLVRAGASVTVVAPVTTDDLRTEAARGALQLLDDRYREEHLRGAFLVVAATDDAALNAAIVRDARRAGALACDASSSDGSQVIFGALLDAGDATIAVFTDGRDPALARRTRDHVADLLARDRDSGGGG